MTQNRRRAATLKHACFIGILAPLLILQTSRGQSARLAPPDEEIRKILADRIDKYSAGVGAVIGVIDAQGRRVIAYGKRDASRPELVDGNTVFAIASVSKVFTSLILADMVERGEVALADPAEKYLGFPLPEFKGRKITLLDLATHTSGLPTAGPVNFAGGLSQETREFLSSYKLAREIGTRFEYSNLGVALLGEALAKRAQLSYGQLLQTRVVTPLGLRNTSAGSGDSRTVNWATAHDAALEPLPPESLAEYGGAGSIQSSVNDLLDLLAAQLGYSPSPLAPAMSRMLAVERSRVPSLVRFLARDMNIHLAWLESREAGARVMWHNGALPGYRSFLGFDPDAHVGVVILWNTDSVGVEDIGFHILNTKVAVLGAKDLYKHKVILLDTAILERYTGRYRFPEQEASVKHVRDHLTLRGDSDGGSPVAFFPETERDFYSRDGMYEMHFRIDRQGHVVGFTFRNPNFSKEVRRTD